MANRNQILSLNLATHSNDAFVNLL